MSVDIRNAQVKNLNVGPTIVTEGLLAGWNAASVHSYPRTGSVWYDLGRNQNNGSLINMSADNFTDDGGGALTFDGTDEYVSIPHDPSIDFGTGSFTVFLWFKPDPTLISSNYVIGKRGTTAGGGNYSGWSINIGVSLSTWSPSNVIIDDGSTTVSSVGTFSIPIGWVSIAFTYNSVSRLFTFSTVSDSAQGLVGYTPVGFGSIANTVPLEMMGTKYYNHVYDYNNFYEGCQGRVANVVIYDRVLTNDELYENYASTRSRFEE